RCLSASAMATSRCWIGDNPGQLSCPVLVLTSSGSFEDVMSARRPIRILQQLRQIDARRPSGAPTTNVIGGRAVPARDLTSGHAGGHGDAHVGVGAPLRRPVLVSAETGYALGAHQPLDIAFHVGKARAVAPLHLLANDAPQPHFERAQQPRQHRDLQLRTRAAQETSARRCPLVPPSAAHRRGQLLLRRRSTAGRSSYLNPLRRRGAAAALCLGSLAVRVAHQLLDADRAAGDLLAEKLGQRVTRTIKATGNLPNPLGTGSETSLPTALRNALV